MADIKDRAREYLAEHSEYSEVFGQTFVAVDTLTAMVEFAEQELKEALKSKRCNCMIYLNFKDLEKENAELKDDNKVMADNYSRMEQKFYDKITKATKVIKDIVEVMVIAPIQYSERQKIDVLEKAEQFLKEE